MRSYSCGMVLSVILATSPSNGGGPALVLLDGNHADFGIGVHLRGRNLDTRHARVDGKTQTFYLHRVIMNPPPGREVIFLNHDRLDCRRENLRIATREEARQHHRMRSDCKTGAKGVRFNGESDTYSAYIYRNGHAYHVGTYCAEMGGRGCLSKGVAAREPGPAFSTCDG